MRPIYQRRGGSPKRSWAQATRSIPLRALCRLILLVFYHRRGYFFVRLRRFAVFVSPEPAAAGVSNFRQLVQVTIRVALSLRRARGTQECCRHSSSCLPSRGGQAPVPPANDCKQWPRNCLVRNL